MKVRRKSGSEERRILTGMIVSTSVVGRIASHWDDKEGLFKNKWANLIGGWCITFFEEYGNAPGADIEGIFEAWASNGQDEEEEKLVGKFLESLSTEYEQLAAGTNDDYIVDLAGKHFNKVRYQRLADALQGDIDLGHIEDAEKRVDSFGRVEIGAGSGVDVCGDEEAWRDAFESHTEPLITYPGALGQFFEFYLEREGFIAFMGPEKRGKSWWMLDIAWMAMRQSRRVAFFEVGDMSQRQVLRRLGARAARCPYSPLARHYPMKVKYPKKITRSPDELLAVVDIEERVYKEQLDWKKAYKAIHKYQTKKSLFKLSVHPNDSLSAKGMLGILQGWEREGWVPDVLVVDYADILAPINGKAETRDQINGTWKALRSISQRLHCLVVTATQADAASYGSPLLGRRNFSEDKRKFAHVTGMVGLNATEEEKEHEIMRLNWIVLREGEFVETKCVHVASCLKLGRPVVHSTF